MSEPEKPRKAPSTRPNGTLRAMALVDGGVLWYAAAAHVSLRALRGPDGVPVEPPRTLVRLGDGNPDGYLAEGDVADVAEALGLGF